MTGPQQQRSTQSRESVLGVNQGRVRVIPPSLSLSQHIQWVVSNDKAGLHTAQSPQVYLARQTCLPDTLRHYTGERVCKDEVHIRHTHHTLQSIAGTWAQNTHRSDDRTVTHPWRIVPGSLSGGTAGLCQIFCGSKWWHPRESAPHILKAHTHRKARYCWP